MSINEDVSFIEYPVDQPTQDFVTNFDTIGGTTDVVLVTVDGVLTDTPESSYTVQQINHTTWRVTPEVQTGSVVRLYRVTNIDEMMHVFTAGAKFIARNMDSNFKQIRHAQQEVRDGFNKLSVDTNAIIDTLQVVGEAVQDAANAAEAAAELANDAAAQVNDKVSYQDLDNAVEDAFTPVTDYIALPFKVGKSYALYERVQLANGDIVKSTVAGNTVDPNVDMVGWLNLSSATTVATTADLIADIGYKDGQEIFVQSRTAGRHKGGGRFYFNSTRTAENDGVTVFNGWVRSKTDKLKPEWAGAVGDGGTDDSAAFRLIRDVGVAKARAVAPYNVNLAVAGYIVSLDPRAKYLVKGANLLGSNEPESPTNPKYSITFEVEGNGSCINYEPLSEFDNLFNIDAFIERPTFKNFNIYVKAELPQKSGVIWKIRSGYNGYHGAIRTHISDVRLDSMSGTANRIRRVFDIAGTTQTDQILVDQCAFGGFREFWKSDNQESVNNTIRNCSFNTTTSGGSIYFNISRMGDNFNLIDCNMSVTAGDTVFNFIAPLNGDGTLINSNPAYQFHMIRCRIETYGAGEVIMLNSNHLKLNIEGLTSALASGSATTKWVWKACDMGSYQFDKCFLNNPQKLLTPILSSLAYGTAVGTGVKLNDTGYLGSLELGAWDGTNEYSVKDALVNKRKARSFRFRDCFQMNRSGAWDFDVVFDDDELSNGIRKQNTVTLNRAGTGFATEFQIPPYQVIDEISVTNSGTLPNTFNGYRVYFGAKSNNNFVDYVDTLSNVVANTETVIFKGKGIVLNDVINSNVISVYALQDGVEVTSKILSSITVKYTALSTYRDVVTSTANATVIKNTLLPKNVGATASRPTKAPYVGWQYFDTTLGKPIFVKTLSPVTWVDATGVVV